jgi:uncharacterized protein
MADAPIPLPPRRRPDPHCPICGKTAVVPHKPFCSRRCADLDLHRWLSDGYRVASDDDTPDTGDTTKE